jgi:hypothetical protein
MPKQRRKDHQVVAFRASLASDIGLHLTFFGRAPQT